MTRKHLHMWWSRGRVTPTSCESHRCSYPHVTSTGCAQERAGRAQPGAQIRPHVARGGPMHCPFCRHGDSRVVDSRASDDGTSIRRRRQCPECGRRFTTVETASLSVTKRSGASEPFSRDKVLAGVRKACQGRPVSEDDLALLAQRVEETVRSSGV